MIKNTIHIPIISDMIVARKLDIPDNQESSDKWIQYTGSNSCLLSVEQRFDVNKSHYVCVYQR